VPGFDGVNIFRGDHVFSSFAIIMMQVWINLCAPIVLNTQSALNTTMGANFMACSIFSFILLHTNITKQQIFK
jgi:hypothetical protein